LTQSTKPKKGEPVVSVPIISDTTIMSFLFIS
jgi:hypothetical protein